MNTTAIKSALVVGVLAMTTLAQAERPPGVGSADVFKDTTDPGCYLGFVDVGGESWPFFEGGEGFVFVYLDREVYVRSNDKNGNVLLKCHGRLPIGEDVIAYDPAQEEWILATLPTVEEACDVLRTAYPDACHGGNSVFTFNYDTTGIACNIGGYLTTTWMEIVTRSGVGNLSCHILP